MVQMKKYGTAGVLVIPPFRVFHASWARIGLPGQQWPARIEWWAEEVVPFFCYYAGVNDAQRSPVTNIVLITQSGAVVEPAQGKQMDHHLQSQASITLLLCFFSHLMTTSLWSIILPSPDPVSAFELPTTAHVILGSLKFWKWCTVWVIVYSSIKKMGILNVQLKSFAWHCDSGMFKQCCSSRKINESNHTLGRAVSFEAGDRPCSRPQGRNSGWSFCVNVERCTCGQI